MNTLLYKDLCERLPYTTRVFVIDDKAHMYDTILTTEELGHVMDKKWVVKPYLRPLSDMTETEKEEILKKLFGKIADRFRIDENGVIEGNNEEVQDLLTMDLIWPNFDPKIFTIYTNWLKKNHFDYNGLIKKQKAISVAGENNPYKQNVTQVLRKPVRRTTPRQDN